MNNHQFELAKQFYNDGHLLYCTCRSDQPINALLSTCKRGLRSLDIFIPDVGVSKIHFLRFSKMSSVQALKLKTDYTATFSYVVRMRLWCFASRQCVIALELVPEKRSLLCAMHYEYDADIWMSQTNEILCVPDFSTSVACSLASLLYRYILSIRISWLWTSCGFETALIDVFLLVLPNNCSQCSAYTKPVTSLGHQGRRRVFWEGPKFFKLCPIVFNYAHHIFSRGTKNFVGRLAPPLFLP